MDISYNSLSDLSFCGSSLGSVQNETQDLSNDQLPSPSFYICDDQITPLSFASGSLQLDQEARTMNSPSDLYCIDSSQLPIFIDSTWKPPLDDHGLTHHNVYQSPVSFIDATTHSRDMQDEFAPSPGFIVWPNAQDSEQRDPLEGNPFHENLATRDVSPCSLGSSSVSQLK